MPGIRVTWSQFCEPGGIQPGCWKGEQPAATLPPEGKESSGGSPPAKHGAAVCHHCCLRNDRAMPGIQHSDTPMLSSISLFHSMPSTQPRQHILSFPPHQSRDHFLKRPCSNILSLVYNILSWNLKCFSASCLPACLQAYLIHQDLSESWIFCRSLSIPHAWPSLLVSLVEGDYSLQHSPYYVAVHLFFPSLL